MEGIQLTGQTKAMEAIVIAIRLGYLIEKKAKQDLDIQLASASMYLLLIKQG